MILIPHATLILAGGVGLRLSSVMRTSTPKQFIKLRDGLSTFQKTVSMAASISGATFVYIITNISMAHIVNTQLGEIGLLGGPHVLTEMHRNNTHQAAKLGLEMICNTLGNITVSIMSADCILDGVDKYIRDATYVSASYKLPILLGIQPREANANFGYMVIGTESVLCAKKVRFFIEKPEQSLLDYILRSYKCLCNAGIITCQSVGALHEMSSAQSTSGLSLDSAILNASSNLLAIEMHETSWMDIGSPKNFLIALGAT